ncbi:hypothetical protein PFISCL1PPCAC_26304, partial [Pristionchus fissidentatus]
SEDTGLSDNQENKRTSRRERQPPSPLKSVNQGRGSAATVKNETTRQLRSPLKSANQARGSAATAKSAPPTRQPRSPLKSVNQVNGSAATTSNAVNVHQTRKRPLSESRAINEQSEKSTSGLKRSKESKTAVKCKDPVVTAVTKAENAADGAKLPELKQKSTTTRKQAAKEDKVSSE